MKIILLRRDKRIVVDLPDILIDLNPKPTRHVLMHLHEPVSELLKDTAIAVENPDAPR